MKRILLIVSTLIVLTGIAVAQTSYCPRIPGAEHVCDQWQQQEQQWLQQDILRELQRQGLRQDAMRHQRRYEQRQFDNWNRAYRNYRMYNNAGLSLILPVFNFA